MMNVNVFIDKKYEKLNESLCKSIIEKVLTHYKYTSYDVNVIFTSDIHLSDLKKEFFSKDQWTDVIAFPLQRDSKFIEGEIYISIPTAKKNANLFKEPYKKELGRLIIHGLLHLLGIEDKSIEQKKKMTILEEKFLEDELWRGLIEKS
jgi:probable rRNA maturation factor